MIVLPRVSGLQEIMRVYGNPEDPLFKDKYLKSVVLPYDMVGEWRPNPVLSRLYVHTAIADSFLDALEEIASLVGNEKLMEDKWNRLGDAYSFRRKKGLREISTHAWGIAFDLNPLMAPWHKKSNQPKVIVDAFLKRGWNWGGSWRLQDGMHFQGAFGY